MLKSRTMANINNKYYHDEALKGSPYTKENML